MSAKQLTLRVDPDPLPDRLRDPVYLGFAFGPKDVPMESCQRAIARFVQRKGHQPRQIICHPIYADAIGTECMGIPVYGEGRARYVVLAGPQEV